MLVVSDALTLQAQQAMFQVVVLNVDASLCIDNKLLSAKAAGLTCLSIGISALHGCPHAVDSLPGCTDGSAEAFSECCHSSR